MKKLALEVWHDLREKRLWPVAAVLALALVAVPVVLKKNSSAAGPATPTAAAPKKLGPVVKPADLVAQNSKLGVFASAKDPFTPTGKAGRELLAAAKAQSNSGSNSTSSNTPSTPSGGSDNGSSGGTAPPADTPDTGNGGGGGDGSQPSEPTKPKGAYTYTVDVKVGVRGSEKTHKGVARLDVLPSDRNPLIVFLGVTSSRDTAVFLLDNTLQADGEGRCEPSGDVCSFLYLKVDRDHNKEEFVKTDEDGTQTEYSIQLLKINRVPASQAKASAKRSAAAKRSAKAYAKKGKPTPFRFLFDVPAFADEVG
ncbi:MAG TPA: hypothetical protein VF752_15915 [Thermoleophilaceae bacterium]